MAFEGLTEKISATFKKLRGKGRLKESDVKEAMREIRMALLEADVSYKVCKDFTKTVTERCVGADVLESLTARHSPVACAVLSTHIRSPLALQLLWYVWRIDAVHLGEVRQQECA